jgi:hypothetical protein
MNLFLKDRTVRIFTEPLENVVSRPEKEIPLEYSIISKIPKEIKRLISEVNQIELIGTNRIRITYESGIAVESGLVVAFIQPWYIKPVSIEISGHSYLGAFQYISKDDKQIEDIYNLYLNSLKEIEFTKEKRVFGIEIANNPSGTDRFIGYITKFFFTESIENPYLLNYELNFVGKPILEHKKEQGRLNALAGL